MEAQQIMMASYLDILYDGKNKKYGGYELRKMYPRRAATAGSIAVLIVGGLFATMLFEPKVPLDNVVDFPPNGGVILERIDPPPTEKVAPNLPPPQTIPPSARPTIVFTAPKIVIDQNVLKENILKEAPKEGVEAGLKFQIGSTDGNGISDELRLGGKPGIGQPGGTEKGRGEETEKESNEILAFVEQPASAKYNWESYLNKSLNYPNSALQVGTQGKVLVKFVVEKDGRITGAKVVRGNDLGNGLPEEAIRVVLAAPAWVPGKSNGKPVRSYFTVPITFKLN